MAVGVVKKLGAGLAASVAGLLLIAAVSGTDASAEVPAPAGTVVTTAPIPASKGSPDPAPSPSENQEATTGSAIAAVEALSVKGRAPKSGYVRAQFGTGWIDVDRNGCDTRNDMLKAELTDRTMSGSCKVLTGSLDDPYTGTDVEFAYGGASEVDIDHVVSLGDAWQKGAQKWSFAKRVAFANDPLNLQPADAGANRSKGDGDAATWLPPNKAYRCQYVATQAAVKTKYGLWVTAAERDALLRVLAACPDQELPDFGSQSTSPRTPAVRMLRKPRRPRRGASPNRQRNRAARSHPRADRSAVPHLRRGQRLRLRPLPPHGSRVRLVPRP